MPKQSVKALVEGGKATAAPPLGPALGPLGVNIGLVVSEINKKTASFKGMQVPITVEVAEDKSFTVNVGTPPASALILKEAGLEKGSGNPLADKVADLRIEQIIKIAKMKEGSLLGKTLKERVKEIIGTCNSMGILVHGVSTKEAIKQVNEGKFNKEIKEEKTELTAEELKELEKEREKLMKEIEARREEYVKTAKSIISSMQGKERSEIKKKLAEAKVPKQIIDELLPAEVATAPEGAAAASAGGPAAAAQKAEGKPKAEGKSEAPKGKEKK